MIKKNSFKERQRIVKTQSEFDTKDDLKNSKFFNNLKEHEKYVLRLVYFMWSRLDHDLSQTKILLKSWINLDIENKLYFLNQIGLIDVPKYLNKVSIKTDEDGIYINDQRVNISKLLKIIPEFEIDKLKRGNVISGI